MRGQGRTRPLPLFRHQNSLKSPGLILPLTDKDEGTEMVLTI